MERYTVTKAETGLICPVYYIYDNIKGEAVTPYLMYWTSLEQAKEKADFLNWQQTAGQPMIHT